MATQMLGFYDLMNIAEQNSEQSQRDASKLKLPSYKGSKNKKEDPKSKELSENVRKFLAKKEEERKQQEREKRLKLEKLAQLRSGDRKAKGRVSRMLKMTKSANKSAIADANNCLNDSIVDQHDGLQPDDDDYGYVSQASIDMHKKLLAQYKTIKKSTPAPPQRLQNVPVPEVKSLSNVRRDSTASTEAEKKKTKKPPPSAMLSYLDLLTLADEKKDIPPAIKVAKTKERKEGDQYEFGRPMTAKEKNQYMAEKALRDRVARQVENGTFRLKPASDVPSRSRTKDKSESTKEKKTVSFKIPKSNESANGPPNHPPKPSTSSISPKVMEVSQNHKSSRDIDRDRLQDRDRERERLQDRDRERDRLQDRERDRLQDRDRERDKLQERDRDRGRERDHERDRLQDRDYDRNRDSNHGRDYHGDRVQVEPPIKIKSEPISRPSPPVKLKAEPPERERFHTPPPLNPYMDFVPTISRRKASSNSGSDDNEISVAKRMSSHDRNRNPVRDRGREELEQHQYQKAKMTAQKSHHNGNSATQRPRLQQRERDISPPPPIKKPKVEPSNNYENYDRHIPSKSKSVRDNEKVSPKRPGNERSVHWDRESDRGYSRGDSREKSFSRNGENDRVQKPGKMISGQHRPDIRREEPASRKILEPRSRPEAHNSRTSINRHDQIDSRQKMRPPHFEEKRKPIIPETKKGRQIIDSSEEDEDEEYDSEMDDFIDDSECNPNTISAMIRQITGYDKRRYREVDDEECMETSAYDQMREESRSLRLGIKEDLEDMRKEEEEKKQKMLKLKQVASASKKKPPKGRGFF